MLLVILGSVTICVVVIVLLARSEGRAKTLAQTAQDAAHTTQTVREELNQLAAELKGRYDALLAEQHGRVVQVEQERDAYKELTAKWSERIDTITTTLGRLADDATQKVGDMASSLKPIVSIFRSPQAAGIEFGEAELELLLKTHLGESLFVRKPRLLAVGQDVVDFAIKLPDCLVPIDSKFPSASYRAWVEASGDEAKTAWRAFRDQLLKQMLATEKYIKPDAGTTDYALLFVPSDIIYQQAFLTQRVYDQENPIPQRSIELQVFGCSPQTLLPIFSLIRLGLRNLKIAEDVKGIRSQIEQLDVLFKGFGEDWKTLRSHVDQLAKHVDKLSSERGNVTRLGEAVKKLSGLSHEADATPALPAKPAELPELLELTRRPT